MKEKFSNTCFSLSFYSITTMRIIRLYEKNTDERLLDEIASALKDGKIIIYPTDSVYAMGCDALNVRAVEKICEIKGVNPLKSNLSIIGSDLSSLSKYVKISNDCYKILRKNLPGPFTFILPTDEATKSYTEAEGLIKSYPDLKAITCPTTVGIRIPSNSIPVKIAEHLENPLLTTSLRNSDSEEEYYTNPELIAEAYEGIVDIVIDGGIGNCEPSAIIDYSTGSPEIIREGSIEPSL